MTKTKAKTMPGKVRPAAARLVIQKPPTTKPHQKKTSACQPIRPTAEGLDHRFLRSQPRVIGPGSLSRARPRQSEYNHTIQPDALNTKTNSNDANRTLHKHSVAR